MRRTPAKQVKPSEMEQSQSKKIDIFDTPTETEGYKRGKSDATPRKQLNEESFSAENQGKSSSLDLKILLLDPNEKWMNDNKFQAFTPTHWMSYRLDYEKYRDSGGSRCLMEFFERKLDSVLQYTICNGVKFRECENLKDSDELIETLDKYFKISKTKRLQMPNVLGKVKMVPGKAYCADLVHLYMQEFFENLSKHRVLEDQKAPQREIVKHFMLGLETPAFRKMAMSRPANYIDEGGKMF